ncbi:MAG: recombinase family protein [Patescibacteria group bacterium]
MIHLFGEDKLRAVAYYRHSAEDKQENSVGNQREQVEEFAAKVDVEILEHFQDEGFTGTNANRPGFQAMLNKWVHDPNAPKIDYILVYDASRFGRFQSRPEAWELLVQLDKRGTKLATVNRGLPKPGSNVMDDIMLVLDFAQAGEQSALLSEKVFYGCNKISGQGYSAGGCAPYGYVRILLNEQRDRVDVLNLGERKMISNQRVSFEPAINGEAEVVKRIFREFVSRGYFPDEITDRLNHDKIVTAKQNEWTTHGIINVLSNETYIGTRVYNKVSSRLNQEKRRNRPSVWTRCLNAHPAIIDELTFRKAQERLYWLRPASHGQSIRQFRSTQSYVWRYFTEIFQRFTEDQQFYLRSNLPVVFGNTYVVGDEKRSCFYIPSKAKRFGKLFAITIDNASEKPSVDSINLVDVQEIGWSNFFITSQNDERPVIDANKIDATLENVCEEVLAQCSPWLKVAPEAVIAPPVAV